MSRGRLGSGSLVGVGVIVGLSMSYGLTAYAFRDNHGPIPLEEIREFTEAFRAIKANYVEPVEDRNLIQQAISGMLPALHPPSPSFAPPALQHTSPLPTHPIRRVA